MPRIAHERHLGHFPRGRLRTEALLYILSAPSMQKRFTRREHNLRTGSIAESSVSQLLDSRLLFEGILDLYVCQLAR
jgi:hypothetical protein